MSEQPRLLYHYTSVDTFRSIVDSGKIRATRFDQMNDESELQIGLERLREAVNEYQAAPKEEFFKGYLLELIDKFRVDPKEVYVVCFSAAENSLEQWRAYAAQGGVAIGFDLNKVREGFLGRSDGQADTRNHLSACNYTDDKGRVDLREVAEKIFNRSYPALLNGNDLEFKIGMATLVADIYGTIGFIKHGAYVNEKEWRSVIYNPNSQTYPVRLNEKGKLFIELPFCSKDFIREVWISPQGDTNTIERVVSYIKRNGDLPFVVRKSAIPYRV